MLQTPTNQPIRVSDPDTPKLESKYIKRKINIEFKLERNDDDKRDYSPMVKRKLKF